MNTAPRFPALSFSAGCGCVSCRQTAGNLFLNFRMQHMRCRHHPAHHPTPLDFSPVRHVRRGVFWQFLHGKILALLEHTTGNHCKNKCIHLPQFFQAALWSISFRSLHLPPFLLSTAFPACLTRHAAFMHKSRCRHKWQCSSHATGLAISANRSSFVTVFDIVDLRYVTLPYHARKQLSREIVRNRQRHRTFSQSNIIADTWLRAICTWRVSI